MIVGVFSRADHPNGWGYQDGRAHGYVTLFVRCNDQHVLDDVAHRLAMTPFRGIDGTNQYFAGHLGDWFGGRFDHIASVPDVDLPYGPYQCRGDNRMVAVYEATDVLAIEGKEGS
jgi:hypothetical protein